MIPIRDAADPRLADYRQLKERHLNTMGRRFIAESERVVRRLIDSGLRVHSILATPARIATLADVVATAFTRGEPFPVYVAEQAVMDGIAGFHVHRGCLAVGERPADPSLPADAHTIVAAEDLVDPENLGAIVRNASGLGAQALFLSPACADPYYRNAIRVSLGGVFTLPIVRGRHWPEDLVVLGASGYTLVAATPRADATPLHEFRRPERMVLLLGSEGPGLSDAVLELADHRVSIPMSGSTDSLNVATACAVFLYALQPR